MKTMTTKQFEKAMGKVAMPSRYTPKMEPSPWDPKAKRYVVACAADGIELVFEQHGGGHTNFKVGESQRTFDRRGVEDSFYWQDWDGKVKDLSNLVEVGTGRTEAEVDAWIAKRQQADSQKRERHALLSRLENVRWSSMTDEQLKAVVAALPETATA